MTTSVYTLKQPVQWGKDKLVEKLSFRRPKGKDMYHFPDKPTQKHMAELAGRLILDDGIPALIIGELDIEDFLGVMEIVGNFMDPSLEIGGMPGLP